MDSSDCVYGVLERLLHDESAEPRELPMELLNIRGWISFLTAYFSDSEKFGEDGYFVLYKGTLPNGIVAVKRLFQSIDGYADDNRFQNEVSCLVRMRAKHKNIVRFLGYCAGARQRMEELKDGRFVLADERERLLRFEYPSGEKLDAYITDASHGFGWRKRYKIIKGICEGLYYLHIHQNLTVRLDLKPANIWLDEKRVPKIHVSGGSRKLEEKQIKVITQDSFRSSGYLPPEFLDGVVTLKTDIYSLGVVITEILTGQKKYPVVENGSNSSNT